MSGRGGARVRSGPPPQEGSARSERRGYSLKTLPPEGYGGPVPDFPLPRPLKREREVWAWLWSTPQACAWSLPAEAWRVMQVAHYARLLVRCEDREAPVGLYAQLARLADMIGMSTAGLAAMGWKIGGSDEPDEVSGSVSRGRQSARERMKLIAGG